MLVAGLQAAGWQGVENRRSVITEFHFILMPGSHHDRQKPESLVGVASTERGAGLRGTAMPVRSTEVASTTRP